MHWIYWKIHRAKMKKKIRYCLKQIKVIALQQINIVYDSQLKRANQTVYVFICVFCCCFCSYRMKRHPRFSSIVIWKACKCIIKWFTVRTIYIHKQKTLQIHSVVCIYVYIILCVLVSYLFPFLFLFPFLRGRTIWFSIQERIFKPNIIALCFMRCKTLSCS